MTETGLLSLAAATALAAVLRAQGGRLVFTNGHFDLVHIGHLEYLERARALGDALIVGINDDDSTRRLKGPGRPLVPAAERARLIAALRPVTGTLIFSGDTAIPLVEAMRPEIYVKGGDYAPGPDGLARPLPERAAVEAYGGQVILIEYLPGHSTSALIAAVRALP